MKPLEDILCDVIHREAQKLVIRHQTYATGLSDEQERMARRSGIRPPKSILMPSYWTLNDGFNPYKVRKRHRTIAYGIAKALGSGQYKPRTAIEYEVAKSGGGTRKVSVFQVADNAVSRLYFKRLMSKNAPRLSSNCYAYRTDLTIHDAVAEIAYSLRERSRLFIAEFDFSKFFDNISHEHIRRLLDEPRFFISQEEKRIIWAFLTASHQPESTYVPTALQDRKLGIPQGTSLSLFLANLAGFPLDRRLERLGVGFVRYADDTLIWSESYAHVCEAAAALEEAARAMSVTINIEKSGGISLLTPRGAPTEISGKSYVEFVGYKISAGTISIKDRKVKSVKAHIAQLIYRNLLEEPKRQRLLTSRVGPAVDRDYVVAIFQIRRYLYGNLTEARLRRYLSREHNRLRFSGLMAFYPIVDDEKLLKELDGWLVHTLWTAVRVRKALFGSRLGTTLPPPYDLPAQQLVELKVTSSTTGFHWISGFQVFEECRNFSDLLR